MKGRRVYFIGQSDTASSGSGIFIAIHLEHGEIFSKKYVGTV